MRCDTGVVKVECEVNLIETQFLCGGWAENSYGPVLCLEKWEKCSLLAPGRAAPGARLLASLSTITRV